MRLCEDCNFAHKAQSENRVFCTYWQNKFESQNELDVESFVKQVIYKKDHPYEIALGFGSRMKHNKKTDILGICRYSYGRTN